jgi:hypothetical protein
LKSLLVFLSFLPACLFPVQERKIFLQLQVLISTFPISIFGEISSINNFREEDERGGKGAFSLFGRGHFTLKNKIKSHLSRISDWLRKHLLTYNFLAFSISLRAVLNFPSTKKANTHANMRNPVQAGTYAKRSSNASLFVTENLKSISMMTTNKTTTKETNHLIPVPIA